MAFRNWASFSDADNEAKRRSEEEERRKREAEIEQRRKKEAEAKRQEEEVQRAREVEAARKVEAERKRGTQEYQHADRERSHPEAEAQQQRAEKTTVVWKAELLKMVGWLFIIELQAMDEHHQLEYVRGDAYGDLELDGISIKRFRSSGRHTHTFTIAPHLNRFHISYDFGAHGISNLELFVDYVRILPSFNSSPHS